jgi:non-ribosomal peptide synthetase component E (peptide arylation enzyme)
MRWSDEQAERYYREGRWERRGLDAMLAEHAARTPDRLACTDGRVSVTWAELDRRARAAAAALLDRGLERGDVVVLRTGNSTDHVVLHYALAAAGLVGYLVPGGASSSAVATAMRRTEARALVTDEPVDPELSGALTAPGLIVAMDDLGDERAVPVADLVSATPRDLPPQDPDDVATLVPTSGTTGTPKIAMRSTNSSLAMARTVVERSGVVPGDVLLVAAPLAGGVGFINAIGTVALTGCTLVMPRDLAPETLLAFVAEHRVTRVATLPTVATRMLNAEAREHTDVTSVKVIQTGGAFLHPGTAAAIERAFGCTAVIVYGAIDVGAPAMVSAADDPPERRHTTVGRVAPGTDLGIMGEDGALLPDG